MLVVGRGPLAVEDALLAQLERLRQEARKNPECLARPVRVLVPSRTLRLHLCSRLVERPPATAGVLVQTLFSAALEILERCGIEGREGTLALELLVRREARAEPELAEAFGELQDGYRSVVAAVRDLLDAGLETAHADAVRELLERSPAAPAVRRRARAIAAVAARALAALEGRTALPPGLLLARARAAFERDPGRALPARALLVHGFGDLTGRAGDLLEALLSSVPGRVFLDEPSDPADPERPDSGTVFLERLRARLARLGATVERAPDRSGSGPALFRAPGAEAEARGVARRIQVLLQEGQRPEAIGVVARDLGPYRSALRIHFERLGIPFSAPRAEALVDGAARAILALAELFRRRERTSSDRWFDALARLALTRKVEGQEKRVHWRAGADLRLALRAAGGARLQEAAQLEVDALLDEKGRFKLPVRSGIWEPAEGPGEDEGKPARGPVAPHRRLDGADLRSAVAAARRTLARLERWPEHAALDRHLLELERLRQSDLGWLASDACEQRLSSALSAARDALGGEELAREEFAWLVQRCAEDGARPPLGGAGAGVACLDAMGARGRTFEQLFVLGLNREVFPRSLPDDPLLSDRTRGELSALLPEIPIKARARDEDRLLFAQLLAAAPKVCVSWQSADEEGKQRVVSPFVDRLLGQRGEEDVPQEPPVLAGERESPAPGPRPAREHVILAALRGGARGLAARLASALEEGGSNPRAAPVRERIVASFESRQGLLPWLGFLGPLSEACGRPDPAHDPIYVTRVERAVRCPWQLALTRFLGLEAQRDPLESLPAIDPLLLGNVVHDVLARVAGRAGRGELGAALARAPLRVPWPEKDELEAWLLDEARMKLAERGLREEGVVRMLRACALPHLERARALLEADELGVQESGCLGVEVVGSTSIPRPCGGVETLHFKADRVDRRDDRLVLTDFKTGKPLKDLLEALTRGESLQAAVYALGADALVDAGRDRIRGRLLYVNPVVEDSSARAELRAESEGWREPLSTVVAAVLDAWRAGTFFPRLTTPDGEKTNPACEFCEVRAACLQGDSGARERLVNLAQSPEAPESLVDLWNIGRSARPMGTTRRQG